MRNQINNKMYFIQQSIFVQSLLQGLGQIGLICLNRVQAEQPTPLRRGIIYSLKKVGSASPLEMPPLCSWRGVSTLLDQETEGTEGTDKRPWRKVAKSPLGNKVEKSAPLVKGTGTIHQTSYLRQELLPISGSPATIKKILYNEIAVDIDSSIVTARKRKTFLSIMNRQYREKRKLSLIYGYLSHKQINRLVNKALHSQKKLTFTTLQRFLSLLEGRPDIILYRSGFAANVYAAKKMVSHGLVKINGRVITTPSIVLNPGDILSVSSSALSHIIRFLSLNRRQRKIYKFWNASARRARQSARSARRPTRRDRGPVKSGFRPKILHYQDCRFFFRPNPKKLLHRRVDYPGAKTS